MTAIFAVERKKRKFYPSTDTFSNENVIPDICTTKLYKELDAQHRTSRDCFPLVGRGQPGLLVKQWNCAAVTVGVL